MYKSTNFITFYTKKKRNKRVLNEFLFIQICMYMYRSRNFVVLCQRVKGSNLIKNKNKKKLFFSKNEKRDSSEEKVFKSNVFSLLVLFNPLIYCVYPQTHDSTIDDYVSYVYVYL